MFLKNGRRRWRGRGVAGARRARPLGCPSHWEIGLQPAASPVMERIEDFHTLLLYIITAISCSCWRC